MYLHSNRRARAGVLLLCMSVLIGGAVPAHATTRAATSPPCGVSWQSVPGANLWPAGGDFQSLAATGPNDGWIVGRQAASHYYENTLVEHWDGTEWHVVPSPAPYRSSTLNAVLAVAPDNAWAVGFNVTDQYAGPGAYQWLTLILHWDGFAWRMVPSPNDPAEDGLNSLAALAASGPDDIWAVGAVTHWNTQTQGSLILHWDGTQWQRMPAASLDSGVTLNGIAARAPDDVWVVGAATNGQTPTPLIAHWDGHSWTQRADAGDHGYLRGVIALAADDAWAVGAPGILRHWDGHAWTESPQAATAAFGQNLYALAAAAPDDVWAVGGAEQANPLLLTTTLHWDGTRWSPVPNLRAVPDGDRADHFAAVAVAGHAFWAVGGTVIGHYTDPCAASPPAIRPYSPVPDLHDPAVAYFPAVQHTLRGSFRAYWEAHGGLDQFGYPLTEPFTETAPTDGRVYTVQYFERSRFEAHPEYADTPNAVLLGLLGRQLTQDRRAEAPFAPVPPGDHWFAPTQHTLAPEFAAYWQAHGGLAVYGYPISEPFQETSPTDGQSYLVQYFERSRFEYHSDLPAAYQVSLGLLGVQALHARGWLR